MCGIAGCWETRAPSAESSLQARISAAAKSLLHRGPDGGRTWVSADSTIAFAHRRLAILDLNERSAQPMLAAQGDAVLTFNGEIYNFQNLRSRVKNHVWRTDGDTEVVLEWLRGHGTAALEEFDGMFALALWRPEPRELLLAVDPFGKKPLYTYWDGRTFAFASEIKAFAAMGLPLTIDADAFGEYLLFGSPLGTATVYKNVQRLLGGHYQRVVNGQPQTPQMYWDLSLGTLNRRISFGDAVEETRRLVGAAVRKRMIADVPLGSFLSGGLDSSVVSAEAARARDSKLRTFSIVFPETPQIDEGRYARAVAQKISSQHFEKSGRVLHRNEIESLLAHFDEPFPDSSLMPTFTLCEMAAQHVKVALSGDGGDEIFGGYRRMQAALATERYPWLFKLVRPLMKMTGSGRFASLRRFEKAANLPLSRRLLEWNSYFPEADVRDAALLNEERLRWKIESWQKKLAGHEAGQSILYFNIKTYLFDDLLPKVDRMSMRCGMEVRSPLLDRDLAEFVFSLPVAYKFNERTTKILLKAAYRKELGSEIVDRRKQGFAAPLAETVAQSAIIEKAGALRPLLERQRGSSRFETCAFAVWASEQSLLNRTQIEGSMNAAARPAERSQDAH